LYLAIFTSVLTQIKSIVAELGKHVGKKIKINSKIATPSNFAGFVLSFQFLCSILSSALLNLFLHLFSLVIPFFADCFSSARAIHFSCHGEAAGFYAGPAGSLLIEQDAYFNGDCKFGEAHVLEGDDLIKQLRIQNGGHAGEVEFVFVSACLSINVGMRFVDLGVPHVIAVNGKVADIAAGMFSTRIYHELFLGKSVRQAFALASREVEACDKVDRNMKPYFAGREEAAKFQLLGKGDHSQPLSFVCHLEDGDVDFSGNSPLSPLLPKNVQFIFQPYQTLIFQLMSELTARSNGRKVFFVHGEAGVGKSSILLESVRYMARRGRRVVWIPCCAIRSPRANGPADAFKAADFQSVATLCNFIGRALGRPDVRGTADLVALGTRASIVFDGVDSLTMAQKAMLFDRESGIVPNLISFFQVPPAIFLLA
jgi:hypothetical protein